MLQLKNIVKTYKTGDTEVKAVKGISINFRKSEFVSILGPSGCGKTTTLNIVGGLDRYTEGDLIINGVSTKDFTDKDWDSYRNHSVGFVFQSYNLIPHQTVEKNVELALTLSGVGKEERIKRAHAALEKVGLKDQFKKLPNQLSGGQMQRVAIARAIVNNPDIILADEPTGALDSETSVQVMDILKELSQSKLVIMVTHNGELAKEYSTRIISLHDGQVVGDTNPFDDRAAQREGIEERIRNTSKKIKKPSMSFLTALSLSLNNLFTKKGRTILTSFAGSIGIIGISLILSLSAGFNAYVQNVQRDTLSNYPVTISSQSMSYSSMLTTFMGTSKHDGEEFPKSSTVSSQDVIADMLENLSSSVNSNDLKSFKKYLDNKELGSSVNAVQYSYNLKTTLYTEHERKKDEKNDKYRQLSPVQLPNFLEMIPNAPGVSISKEQTARFASYYTGFQNLVMSEPILSEMIDNRKLIEEQYEFLAGTYPQNAEDMLLVVDNYNQISDLHLYMMGLMDDEDIKYVFYKIFLVYSGFSEEKSEQMLKEVFNLERSEIYTKPYTFEKFLGMEYKVLLNAEKYKYDNPTGLYTNRTEEEKQDYLNSTKVKNLKIKGVVRLKKGVTSGCLGSTLCYTKNLTNELIEKNNNLPVIKALKASFEAGGKGVLDENGIPNNDTAIFDGSKIVDDKSTYSIFKEFEGENDLQEETTTYINKSKRRLLKSSSYNILVDDSGKPVLDENGKEQAPASNDKYRTIKSYDDREKTLGVVDLDTPSAISIYPSSFEAKDDVIKLIDDYNAEVAKEGDEGKDKQIKYEDYIGLMMSSITTIINAVTYVLIAFVSTSLIVSSIMIGIITYISVLERTKEIGVLRSIGASKRDVARVFNAETIIIGLTAGLLGIGITLLLNIPINIIINNLAGLTNVAALPVWGGVSLVLISVLLTVIAGLFPANMASKQDPVIALRSE